MVLLELFSGIGGFSKGLETAGYTFDKVYFSEIDKHAIANFKYNFPYAEHIGTVTNIYNPQIQISAESETKRSIFREKDKTKRSKKESAQHSKSRNKSFVMTSVSAL